MKHDELQALVNVAGHWPGKATGHKDLPDEVTKKLMRCIDHLDDVTVDIKKRKYGVAAEYVNLARKRLQTAQDIPGWQQSYYWEAIYNGGEPVYKNSQTSDAIDALDQLHEQLEYVYENGLPHEDPSSGADER